MSLPLPPPCSNGADLVLHLPACFRASSSNQPIRVHEAHPVLAKQRRGGRWLQQGVNPIERGGGTGAPTVCYVKCWLAVIPLVARCGLHCQLFSRGVEAPPTPPGARPGSWDLTFTWWNGVSIVRSPSSGRSGKPQDWTRPAGGGCFAGGPAPLTETTKKKQKKNISQTYKTSL